jgi:hypothetical protein
MVSKLIVPHDAILIFFCFFVNSIVNISGFFRDSIGNFSVFFRDAIVKPGRYVRKQVFAWRNNTPGTIPLHEIIRLNSGTADIVFIGLKIPGPGSEADYAKKLSAIANGLSTVIFVRNAGEFAGNLI